MVTNIQFETPVGELRKNTLQACWKQYFEYEKNIGLRELSLAKLAQHISVAKASERPFLDSQHLVSKVSMELGTNFQKMFTVAFPEFNKRQILAMQLHKLIVEDSGIWVYFPMQTAASDWFPNATYTLNK
jgi:hypothetical protein